jgi:hypothetical protein
MDQRIHTGRIMANEEPSSASKEQCQSYDAEHPEILPPLRGHGAQARFFPLQSQSCHSDEEARTSAKAGPSRYTFANTYTWKICAIMRRRSVCPRRRRARAMWCVRASGVAA